jgi:hypothetical protein
MNADSRRRVSSTSGPSEVSARDAHEIFDAEDRLCGEAVPDFLFMHQRPDGSAIRVRGYSDVSRSVRSNARAAEAVSHRQDALSERRVGFDLD